MLNALTLRCMNTLETDIEIALDGSIKLLSPLPAWVKPGRQHAWLTIATNVPGEEKPKRQAPVATPEMVARRLAALTELRAMGGLKEVIPDPMTWQREMREDVALPGRE